MLVSIEWLRHRLRELVVDRGRVVLVILGILWGVLSLTVVLSFGQGFHTAMAKAIWASGHNLIRISTGMTTQPHAGLPGGRWIQLVPEDVALLEKSIQGVHAISVEFRSPVDTLEYQGRQINIWTHGVNACYGEMRSLQPQPEGRFLNEQDDAERRRVIFLGNTIKENLFGSAPAVGEQVKLWGTPFTVVGILKPKVTMSDYNGSDSKKVFIPASTFQALRNFRNVTYMIVGLESPEDDQSAVRTIRRVLGERYQFDPADTAALEVWNQITEDRHVMSIVNVTRILMGIVGVLGLLVALIGVANVMYVLVEERRQEIGIQMALGARPSILMAGFFFEGLVLTFCGGTLGLSMSAGVLWLFNRLPLDASARGYLGQPEVSFASALVITIFLGIAGCAAVFFPARRAAGLDPVTALREE